MSLRSELVENSSYCNREGEGVSGIVLDRKSNGQLERFIADSLDENRTPEESEGKSVRRKSEMC